MVTMKTYKAKLIKENHPPKYKYQILGVKVDKKHGYFEVTTKIYHHQIIELIRFNECDSIELFDSDTPCYSIKQSPIMVFSRGNL